MEKLKRAERKGKNLRERSMTRAWIKQTPSNSIGFCTGIWDVDADLGHRVGIWLEFGLNKWVNLQMASVGWTCLGLRIVTSDESKRIIRGTVLSWVHKDKMNQMIRNRRKKAWLGEKSWLGPESNRRLPRLRWMWPKWVVDMDDPLPSRHPLQCGLGRWAWIYALHRFVGWNVLVSELYSDKRHLPQSQSHRVNLRK
jgi:hypothetical protein